MLMDPVELGTTSMASPATEQDENDNLLTGYEAIDYAAVTQEMETFRAVAADMEDQWAKEVSKYEETIELSVEGRTIAIPRRNYPNVAGEVQDETLYPYHTACYPLLDAYDSMYEEGRSPSIEEYSHPSGMDVDRRRPPMMEIGEDLHNTNHLPCSPNAIEVSLKLTDTYVPIWEATEVWVDECKNGATYFYNSLKDPNYWLSPRLVFPVELESLGKPYGPNYFPSERNERADLLLRLTRHALSDLQRDHLLASTLMQRIAHWKLCDDVSFFRRLLSIIMAERIPCTGDCSERYLQAMNGELEAPDHSCHDWESFETIIPSLFWLGISYVTEEHANLICAIVRHGYDTANPAAASMEQAMLGTMTEVGNARSLQSQQKTLLKQNLYFLNNTDAEDDSTDENDGTHRWEAAKPYQLLRSLLSGIGSHAALDRRRIFQLRESLCQEGRCEQRDSSKVASLGRVLTMSINSFYNCIRTMVQIGEMSVRRLPANQHSVMLCSILVAEITEAFIHSDYLEVNEESAKYLVSRLGGLEPLISPSRYADTVSHTANYSSSRGLPSNENIVGQTIPDDVQQMVEVADTFLNAKPHKDVVDVIRGLFARDLVDADLSGCGYGDILVWLGLPVCPLDPLVFYHVTNFPEEVSEETPWVLDEDGNSLNIDELSARYDFTLLMLLRAWHAPWTPESHHSFQTQFRQAAKTLALCAHRVGMPNDIAMTVIGFLRRDWWPDERSQCWCEDCQHNGTVEIMHEKMLHRMDGGSLPGKTTAKLRRNASKSQSSMHFCTGCRIPMYCSLDHERNHYLEGHKRLCGKPPFRIPGKEEEQLCQEVFASTLQARAICETTNEMDEMIQDDEAVADGDEGSWESIDSDEEEAEGSKVGQSITRTIFKWFNSKAYKTQRMESPPFENIYTVQD